MSPCHIYKNLTSLATVFINGHVGLFPGLFMSMNMGEGGGGGARGKARATSIEIPLAI